ncbi:MAG: 50S ribosomal protein L5 [Chloroflexi bacterium]|mgnify:FL=1|jgi:large subunit ribosomal protein L5|nr:50S ribosomal protein L5 [Chloroflexota bacterium]|tara:strand:+ start:1812 stop:2372 length:561 start_codon:yes stop_codon:yes gene_type:complete
MVSTANIPRMLKQYKEDAVPVLLREFGYQNSMEVPTISKISVNIGLGEAVTSSGVIESASEDLMAITGQRPFVRRARESISNFKLREGMPIGLAVTLRRNRMWEFYDRLVNSSMPRIRDFRGCSDRAFDGRGNYSLGISEQLIFPELNFEDVDRVRGLQVNFVTSAKTDEEGRRLLALLGMPFQRR